MNDFVTGLKLSFKALSAWSAIDDAVTDQYIITSADHDLVAFFEGNHPDFLKLTSGDITGLTVHAVLYEYYVHDGTGTILLDDLTHDPIPVRGVIFRYVGGGTSSESASYLKLVSDPDFFDDDRVEVDTAHMVGENTLIVKDALVEMRWNHLEGFKDNKVQFDVSGVVKSAKKLIAVHKGLSALPSLEGRLNAVKQSQLSYESAMESSLSLEDKVTFATLTAGKNAILADLTAAIADYEDFRKELQKKQSLQMMEFFLSAASIMASAANSAASKVKFEEMQQDWKALNDKLDAVSEQASALSTKVNAISSQLDAWEKPIPEVYNIMTINVLVPSVHEDVFEPVPMAGPNE